MTGFGIYPDGLDVGDEGERKRGQVSLQIPWLGTW